jgi:flagellar basal body-associated protein FliL
MKKHSIIALVLGIAAFALALAGAVTAIHLFLEKKKKDEEELEHYLDCSIQ